MTKSKKSEGDFSYIALSITLSLLIIALEGFYFVKLYHEEITLLQFIILHFVLVFICMIFLIGAIKSGKDFRLPILLFLFTLISGFIGGIICIVVIILHGIYSKVATNFSEWLSSLFPDEVEFKNDLYDRLQFGWEDFGDKSGVVPFKDVIELGNEGQKRVALAKMTSHFRPEFAESLLVAINDKSNSIRVQAATSISRIDRDFSHAIVEMEKKLSSLKNTKKREEIILKLAKTCDSYSSCGLIDEDRAHDIGEKAIVYYEKFLKYNPKDDDVKFMLGRVYFILGDLNKSKDIIATSLKNKMSGESGVIQPEVIKFYMKTLFSLNLYGELKEFCESSYHLIDADNVNSLQVFEYLKLWVMGSPKEVSGGADA